MADNMPRNIPDNSEMMALLNRRNRLKGYSQAKAEELQNKIDTILEIYQQIVENNVAPEHVEFVFSQILKLINKD